MQPLVGLAGAACPPAVRWAAGTCTGEPTGKLGVTSAAPRISASSRNVFAKWNSRGTTERGAIGGSHTLFASISGRHSLKVKASAATEVYPMTMAFVSFLYLTGHFRQPSQATKTQLCTFCAYEQ